MKKQLIIIGIIALLVCVGLSGCNENNDSINTTSKIEIVEHHIENKGWLGWWVSGTIKNIADYNSNKVTITVRFYDSDNELLITKTDTVYYLAKGITADFGVYYQDYEKYFDQYDHYTVSTSP